MPHKNRWANVRAYTPWGQRRRAWVLPQRCALRVIRTASADCSVRALRGLSEDQWCNHEQFAPGASGHRCQRLG